MEDVFRVTILGTGTPVPLIERMGCSILINTPQSNLLVDCGRGAAQRIYQTDTPLKRVNTIFLTHLHYDHCIGISDIWLTGWLNGREEPMLVYGPPGTKDMMFNLSEAYKEDIHIRRDLDEKLYPDGALLFGYDITDNHIQEFTDLRLESFAVDHNPVPDARGYIVTSKDRKIIISGDTRYMPKMANIAKDADILIHEVSAPNAIRKRSHAIGRNDSHTDAVIDHHTSPDEATKIFSAARPKLAVYYHIVGGPGAEEEIISTTNNNYAGEFILPDDLTSLSIGDQIVVRDPSGNILMTI